MPQWTDDQKSVINASEKRVICSAAAGSGKTAVMVERIVRLIREGARLVESAQDVVQDLTALSSPVPRLSDDWDSAG